MPLEVRHSPDQALLHRNEFVAADFDVPHLVEASRELDLPIGRGTMTHWYFRGLRLGHAHWHYRHPVATQWRADLDVVHLHVNLRGRSVLEHNVHGPTFRLAAQEHALFYIPAFDGTLHHHELETETFMVQFTRPTFLALTDPAASPLRAFTERVRAGQPAVLTDAGLPLSLPMHRAIQDVLTCRLPSGFKQLYLHAKALELLALQGDALARARQPGQPRLSEYDLEQLHFARDYVVQHLHRPPTLPELARLAGLNECKLKQGFKALFGLPVFAYLSEYRLTEAHRQLSLGQRTPTELAFELGYSSLPHFSAAFRKRFGVAPRTLRP